MFLMYLGNCITVVYNSIKLAPTDSAYDWLTIIGLNILIPFKSEGN